MPGKKHTLEEAQELAKSRGGLCLSTTYINTKSKLLWRCKFGHEWEAIFASVIKGTWCGCCANQYEEICRRIFETVFEEKFPKYRASWLKSPTGYPMELDGYCEGLGIAFEHHGKQHYQIIDKFKMTQESLDKTKKYDAHKMNLCAQNNIKLIIIPQLFQLTKLNNVVGIIESQGARVKTGIFDINKIISEVNMRYENGLQEAKEIAAQLGTTCVSTVYVNKAENLDFICAKGHEYRTTVNTLLRIIKGAGKTNGCKKCAGLERLTIEQINGLITDAKCISEEYVNNRCLLTFVCGKGHKFESSWHQYRPGLCEKCFGKRFASIDDIRTMAEAKGEVCLSGGYISSEKLIFLCSNGHEFKAMYQGYRAGRSRCRACET